MVKFSEKNQCQKIFARTSLNVLFAIWHGLIVKKVCCKLGSLVFQVFFQLFSLMEGEGLNRRRKQFIKMWSIFSKWKDFQLAQQSLSKLGNESDLCRQNSQEEFLSV